MENKKWHGILKILWLEKRDAEGNLVCRQENLKNLLHYEGEDFILRAVFSGGRVSDVIPENYYLGLDNRTNIEADQTLDDLIGEPSGGGYQRQSVSSSGGFDVGFSEDHYRAVSPIVAFRAITDDWGPVSNLFLTDKDSNTGSLISSTKLESAISLNVGESVTMRIALVLRDCSS